MRILHTSDWHLGRDFGPVSLHDDQKAFLEWLVGQVRKLQIDLVVIAGDLFDRAYAPADAIRLFRDALHELLGTGAKVAAITGNHDAHDRVANYGGLLDLSGLYLRGGYQAVGEVIALEFSDGPLDLVLLPFLDPQGAPDSLGAEAVPAEADPVVEGADDAFAGHSSSALERRMQRTHQSVLQAAVDEALPSLRGVRSVAVAHAFVAGCTTTESERQFTVGGAGTVDASVFAPFSYTALGHLHRPQRVGSSNAFYSGTPLPYSFSEEHGKSVHFIEMASDGTFEIEGIDVPVRRPVATICGTMEELLDPTRFPEAIDSLVRAIITDRETVLHARARLETVYRHVVEVALKPGNVEVDYWPGVPDAADVSPLDLTLQFWQAAEGQEASLEVRAVIEKSLDAAVRSLEAVDQ